MTVIRCETCKGTGKIKIELPDWFNVAWKTREEIENLKIKICPNCGGSGCKWR